MRGVGTNNEDTQLPKQVWQSLVKRSLQGFVISWKCELVPKQVHVVLGHTKNDG